MSTVRHRERRNTWRRVRAGLVSVVAALASVLGATAAPAHASPVLILYSADSFKIQAPQVDFGNGNLNISGNPSQYGNVLWMRELYDPDVLWPHLSGLLFINNAAGLCARMRMVYHDSNGQEIAARNGGTVCSPDNRRNAWTVDLMPFGSEDIDHIHVHLQTVGASGSATTVRYSTLYP